ncbi:Cu,Zn superoxide dismutase-like protein [Aspergillus steynii IBT 23096]|uniref:Superoxide dismutase 1 copper chaperone n=1 Tax=Aspergillus steynii IBT 23096 TaxID=1392250 RepID=A0A2I2G5F4_9EURO|nr:Cu,Zn superoxide dismutase-like protein [Aspergillus steynii IBT 23096]PLB48115.1 Cu,Zn superoxide dismutase-like protein [Aspergillus steynii IBT 23096]
MIEPFQTTFAVPMTCDGCVKDISSSLKKVEGVNKVEADLKGQLVFIEGTAAPSSIVTAIQATGRDAILRGSGTSNSSAVCILETHSTTVSNKIRGLARMVQVSPSMTLVDLTINGLAPGQYWATVRQAGDISQGATSTGGIWEALKSTVLGTETTAVKEPRGVFGRVDVDAQGRGNVFLDRPVAIWEMIGRSMVVSKSKDGPFRKDDADTLVGVIARSAGVWDNDKMVCSCSGKNVWQERQEQVAQGMA